MLLMHSSNLTKRNYWNKPMDVLQIEIIVDKKIMQIVWKVWAEKK